jgi:hypothetical protein
MKRLRKCLKGPAMDCVKIGRKQGKRWDAIYTCLTNKAITHRSGIVIATDSAIMVIRRFCGRNGVLKKLNCDIVTNFRGAETKFQIILLEPNGDRLNCEFAEANIKWKFNLPVLYVKVRKEETL